LKAFGVQSFDNSVLVISPSAGGREFAASLLARSVPGVSAAAVLSFRGARGEFKFLGEALSTNADLILLPPNCLTGFKASAESIFASGETVLSVVDRMPPSHVTYGFLSQAARLPSTLFARAGAAKLLTDLLLAVMQRALPGDHLVQTCLRGNSSLPPAAASFTTN
jgi:hypothetical protein